MHIAQSQEFLDKYNIIYSEVVPTQPHPLIPKVDGCGLMEVESVILCRELIQNGAKNKRLNQLLLDRLQFPSLSALRMQFTII